jgi:error-prone DNA polymerase
MSATRYAELQCTSHFSFLTHDRLDELVPIEPAAMKDRQVIEWDKDDDALRSMKVDCFGLWMLS